MMTREEALDKAAKAHRLAMRPGTEAEGKVAAAMRDRIMAAAGISLADVEAKIARDENPRGWLRDAMRNARAASNAANADDVARRRRAEEAADAFRRAAEYARAQREQQRADARQSNTNYDGGPTCNCGTCRRARRAQQREQASAEPKRPRATRSARSAAPKATPDQVNQVRDYRAQGWSFRRIDEVVFNVYDRKGWVSFSVARKAGIQ